MSAEENKALVRRFIDEFWNNRNLDVADEIFAPEVVSRSHQLPPDQLPPGPEGVKTIARMVFGAFPDFHLTIEDLIAEGEKVVVRLVNQGTHNGEFMGIAPTSRQATWTKIGIFRIGDGKVVETWFEMDMLGLLQQLGAARAYLLISPPGMSAIIRDGRQTVRFA